MRFAAIRIPAMMAMLGAIITVGLHTDTPVYSLFSAGRDLKVLALAVLAAFLFIATTRILFRRIRATRLIAQLVMDALLGTLAVLAFIPGILALLQAGDLLRTFPLDACGIPQIRDYYLFVIDNIAKGAFIEFFESFHISLTRCRANPESYVVSAISLLLRLYATFIIVAAGLKAWRIWRVRSRKRADGKAPAV